MSRREELKRLHAAATPGPWVRNRAHGVRSEDYVVTVAGLIQVLDDDGFLSHSGGVTSHADRDAIVALHNAAPALFALAELAIRASKDSVVTTSDEPGCFFCDTADGEHAEDCPYRKALADLEGDDE